VLVRHLFDTSLLGAAEVVGIDAAAERLDVATARGIRGATFECFDRPRSRRPTAISGPPWRATRGHAGGLRPETPLHVLVRGGTVD